MTIGTGPHAELRYPSYPAGKWHFPGIGEFMCYDSRMSRRLKEAAEEAGAPKEWGGRGPGNCGHYCMQPHETPFFRDEGQWASKQGDFFLKVRIDVEPCGISQWEGHDWDSSVEKATRDCCSVYIDKQGDK